jgi:hypothetical protein
MEWLFKGIRFKIETETMGPFCLASARAPRVGAFVRIKPFSALGKSESEAVRLLKRQIEFEFKKTPEV